MRTISETRFSDFTERRIRVHVETKGADSQSREIVQEHNSVNTNTNHLTHAMPRINVCNFMLELCGIKKKTFVDIFDHTFCVAPLYGVVLLRQPGRGDHPGLQEEGGTHPQLNQQCRSGAGGRGASRGGRGGHLVKKNKKLYLFILAYVCSNQ